MNLEEHIQAWTHATFKISDIRRYRLSIGEQLDEYVLPTSAFLLTTRGCAQIGLGDRQYLVDGVLVLHGGKGLSLTIKLIDDRFEYVLLLYKASLALPAADDSPFHLHYAFAPSAPGPLSRTADELYRAWWSPKPVERLHARSLFLQFVHELIQQLAEQQLPSVSADPVERAVQYIREHYADPITLESLASCIDCSPGHLSRLFKKQIGSSPIDYLIQIRIERAQAMLLQTNAPLREIAASVGYPDPYYFSRIFKKLTGRSPSRFRTDIQLPPDDQHNPSVLLRSSIVPRRLRRYINDGDDNRYQYNQKGDLPMRHRSSSSSAYALLLILTLLLAACSGGGTSGSTTAGVSGAPDVSATATSSDLVTYKAVNGDVQVPRNPQRIVVLTHAYVGYFMALGIQPVGVPAITLSNPYYEGKLGGMTDVGSWGAFSTEKIIELNPDLIIALDSMKNFAEISKIAPTVGIKYGQLGYKDQLIEFGKLTNREQQARKWVSDWEARIAESKPKVQQALGERTVSVLDPYEKGVYVYGENFGRGTEILYDEFGLKAPPAFDLKQGSAEISLEKLPEFAGDYIFATKSGSSPESKIELYDNVLWKNLPAVQNNRVFYFDPKSAAFNDPITLEGMLPLIVNHLLNGKSS